MTGWLLGGLSMSPAEFEAWFTPERLREALAVALEIIRRQKTGYFAATPGNWVPDAEDVVQAAGARAFGACIRLVVSQPADFDRCLCGYDCLSGAVGAWPFLTSAIRSEIYNMAISRARERRTKRRLTAALSVDGPSDGGDYGTSGRYAGKVGLGWYNVAPSGFCKAHGGAYEKLTIEVGRDRLQRRPGASGGQLKVPRYEVVKRLVYACANGGRRYKPLDSEADVVNALRGDVPVS